MFREYTIKTIQARDQLRSVLEEAEAYVRQGMKQRLNAFYWRLCITSLDDPTTGDASGYRGGCSEMGNVVDVGRAEVIASAAVGTANGNC